MPVWCVPASLAVKPSDDDSLNHSMMEDFKASLKPAQRLAERALFVYFLRPEMAIRIF